MDFDDDASLGTRSEILILKSLFLSVKNNFVNAISVDYIKENQKTPFFYMQHHFFTNFTR